MANGFITAVALLPPAIAEVCMAVPAKMQAGVQELRFRVGHPVCVICAGQGFYLEGETLVKTPSPQSTVLNAQDINGLFLYLCNYSVPSFEEELRQGFMPLAHGHRAGVCGKAVYKNEKCIGIENITSINLRIAFAQKYPLINEIKTILQADKGGILIAGPPASGKTSALRSILWALEEIDMQVVLVDEREEIMPMHAGSFLYGTPRNCDILTGYKKAQGLLQALRLLAPGVLVCDEIGTVEDANAIAAALHAGARVIASIHIEEGQSLHKRPQAVEILKTGAFKNIVLLKSRTTPGEVLKIEEIKNDF